MRQKLVVRVRREQDHRKRSHQSKSLHQRQHTVTPLRAATPPQAKAEEEGRTRAPTEYAADSIDGRAIGIPIGIPKLAQRVLDRREGARVMQKRDECTEAKADRGQESENYDRPAIWPVGRAIRPETERFSPGFDMRAADRFLHLDTSRGRLPGG